MQKANRKGQAIDEMWRSVGAKSGLYIQPMTRMALPALALVAFWLMALGPLAHPGMMTLSHDGLAYFLRVFQLDTLVRQGVLWPRWVPGMVFGYGYPLFDFHPVLSLYPAVILHYLGLSLLQSWNLSLALSILASGLTMYLWAHRVLGQRGGCVAAVAYMLAPYQLYDVYWRGALAESLTLPLLPLVLWAALRVAQEQRWRYVSVGALAYAAVLLAHSPASLIFTPVLMTFMLVLVWGTLDRRATLFKLAGMMILGLGLAAFFLIPAYVEKGQVQLWRATEGADLHDQFLSLVELLGPARASDPLLVNSSAPRSLGTISSLLAVIGIFATWWGRTRVSRAHRHHITWASIVLVPIVVMTLPISEPIWSRVPLLPFLQFPMRFLGAGSLLVSLLAGAGVAVLDSAATDWRARSPLFGFGQPVVLGLCGVMLAAGALPWAYPHLRFMPHNPDQAFFIDFEEGTKWLGTTAFSEYLPTAVSEFPTTSPMVKAMRTGQPFVRWDAPGAHVLEARDDGLSAELVLESAGTIQVMYRAFSFPGWQAQLDGQSVPLVTVPPLGLMAIKVPAGRHTVTVHFGTTPLRAASEVISLLAALVIVAVGWADLRRRLVPKETNIPGCSMRPAAWLGFVTLGIILLGLKLGVIDRYDTLLRWRRFQNGQFTSAMYTVQGQVVIADRAHLLGYDLHSRRVASGDVVMTDLYWTLTKPLAFATALRLVDEHGVEWSYKDELATFQDGYSAPPPSREWSLGEYADDRHAIRILPGTPPGDYWVVVVPYNPATLDPLPVTSGQAAPSGYPGLAVDEVKITRPQRPPQVDTLGLTHVQAPLGDDLTLVGYSQDREEAIPGQGMLLTLGWQARRPPQSDFTQRLELVASDGQVVAQKSLAPGGDHYPTSHWAAGEMVRAQVLVRVPGRAGSGQHEWRVTLLDSNGAPVGQAKLGSIQITAPPRVFASPTVSFQVNTHVGEWFTLVGFDLPNATHLATGQSLPVTLVWQATTETEGDYKVFIHLLDANGQLVAQSDAVPGNWTRPTSGWQAGEFITDSHTLDLRPQLPPGEYRLVAGMYDAGNGQRLPVTSGNDSVELGKIQVSAASH